MKQVHSNNRSLLQRRCLIAIKLKTFFYIVKRTVCFESHLKHSGANITNKQAHTPTPSRSFTNIQLQNLPRHQFPVCLLISIKSPNESLTRKNIYDISVFNGLMGQQCFPIPSSGPTVQAAQQTHLL